jgi:tRNA pseudouridine32 synthase/23S rRNA pseudouridine746 synthase
MIETSETSWKIDIVEQSTALEALRVNTQLNGTQIKDALNKGAVWIERWRDGQYDKARRLRRAKNSVSDGDRLFMYYNPRILAMQIPNPQLIEDLGDYSVWDKPAGMLCEGTRWADHCALARRVSTHMLADRACFLVHRLDKMTSGLVLLAHNKKAARALSQLFALRQVHKSYRALVHGEVLTSLPMRIDQPIDGKSAVSHIIDAKPASRLLNINEVTEAPMPLEKASELAVTIETGRTHQIRRHLASIGWPVVGDRLYGLKSDALSQSADLQLRASSLSFQDPFSSECREWRIKS